MSGPAPNLRPYGDSWSNSGGAPVAGNSIEEQSLNRARNKLDILRSGLSGEKPCGPEWIQVVPGAIIALIIGVPLLIGAGAALVKEGSIPIALILGGLALAFFAIPVLVWIQSKPATPKRALNAFYKALARNRSKRARKLAVEPDFDSFPRYQPVINNLGNPSMNPRPFANIEVFASYWNELIRSHSSPYCFVRIKDVQETPIGHDLMLVEFQLKLTMNTGLWAVLILVAWPLALILDLATRKRVKVEMRKLLFKVGDEWHLFSAEWQGYEEYDTSWLRPTGPSGASPTQRNAASRH